MIRRLGIRAKTALLSGLLLLVPVVGYQYVREMETFLRAGLETAVLEAAGALAGALHERDDLMPPDPGGPGGDDLYVHPLPHARQIDGYPEDWPDHLDHLVPVPVIGAASARLVAGRFRDHLYLLLRVQDPTAHLPAPGPEAVPGGDHVRLSTGAPGGRRQIYFLATSSPGWMSAYESASAGQSAVRPTRLVESRIRAELQETADGYDIEMRMPVALLGGHLALEVHDTGRPGAPPVAAPPRPPGRLVMPSQVLEDLILGLSHRPGRRMRIVDARGRIIARGGGLGLDDDGDRPHALLEWLFGAPSAGRLEDAPVVARLRAREVEAALAGVPASRWRTLGDGELFVVSAANPIWNDGEVVGAVVVEESTRGIQTVRYRALLDLIGRTALVFGVGAVILLLFATRITRRLLRLRDDAEQAIDEHGRVVGRIRGSDDGDEIGELARSFAVLTDRLRQYNHYLEQLARRLSHELRTPVAVVRSSLDSIEMQGAAADDAPYLTRAREGVERLHTIISRMSEASRLEETLRGVEPERFDLAEVVGAAAGAYADTWPGHRFEARLPNAPCPLTGAPELILQMLDKLVSNAMEFSTPGRPIRIELDHEGGLARLVVANEGPFLPEVSSTALFESMVSIRAGADGPHPHLGLGLYIVRLIAEHHGASVEARNVDEPAGVMVTVTFPAQSGPARSGDRA